jgi:putative cardiolipin synthase
MKFYQVLFVLLLTACSSSRKNEPTPVNCSTSDTSGIISALRLADNDLKNNSGICSLEDGILSLTSRAWLCEHAKKTIDVQYYIFSKDNTGLISCDFLVRAASRGIKVRMIIDDATVKANSHEIFALDSHENIEIKIYNPGFKLGKPGLKLKKITTELHKLQKRMHAKSITVDELVSITGGRNIADEYYDYDEHYNFRDRDALIIGKAVASVRASFEQYWNHELCIPFQELTSTPEKDDEKEHFERLKRYACDPNNFSQKMRARINAFPADFSALEQNKLFLWLKDLSFVSDPPGKNEERLNEQGSLTTDSLLFLLSGAKKSVKIHSPYVITTDEGKELLRKLVDKGIIVRVLTNSMASTDNKEAFSGYHRDRDELLKTGIELFEFKPDAAVRYKLMNPELQSTINYSAVYGLHSKSMVIDNRIAVIGSFNLDPRSANLNTECLVISRDTRHAANLLKYMNEEFLPENSWQISKTFNPDSVAGTFKRLKIQSRKILPKNIL